MYLQNPSKKKQKMGMKLYNLYDMIRHIRKIYFI